MPPSKNSNIRRSPTQAKRSIASSQVDIQSTPLYTDMSRQNSQGSQEESQDNFNKRQKLATKSSKSLKHQPCRNLSSQESIDDSFNSQYSEGSQNDLGNPRNIFPKSSPSSSHKVNNDQPTTKLLDKNKNTEKAVNDSNSNNATSQTVTTGYRTLSDSLAYITSLFAGGLQLKEVIIEPAKLLRLKVESLDIPESMKGETFDNTYNLVYLNKITPKDLVNEGKSDSKFDKSLSDVITKVYSDTDIMIKWSFGTKTMSKPDNYSNGKIEVSLAGALFILLLSAMITKEDQLKKTKSNDSLLYRIRHTDEMKALTKLLKISSITAMSVISQITDFVALGKYKSICEIFEMLINNEPPLIYNVSDRSPQPDLSVITTAFPTIVCTLLSSQVEENNNLHGREYLYHITKRMLLMVHSNDIPRIGNQFARSELRQMILKSNNVSNFGWIVGCCVASHIRYEEAKSGGLSETLRASVPLANSILALVNTAAGLAGLINTINDIPAAADASATGLLFASLLQCVVTFGSKESSRISSHLIANEWKSILNDIVRQGKKEAVLCFCAYFKEAVVRASNFGDPSMTFEDQLQYSTPEAVLFKLIDQNINTFSTKSDNTSVRLFKVMSLAVEAHNSISKSQNLMDSVSRSLKSKVEQLCNGESINCYWELEKLPEIEILKEKIEFISYKSIKNESFELELHSCSCDTTFEALKANPIETADLMVLINHEDGTYTSIDLYSLLDETDFPNCIPESIHIKLHKSDLFSCICHHLDYLSNSDLNKLARQIIGVQYAALIVKHNVKGLELKAYSKRPKPDIFSNVHQDQYRPSVKTIIISKIKVNKRSEYDQNELCKEKGSFDQKQVCIYTFDESIQDQINLTETSKPYGAIVISDSPLYLLLIHETYHFFRFRTESVLTEVPKQLNVDDIAIANHLPSRDSVISCIALGHNYTILSNNLDLVCNNIEEQLKSFKFDFKSND